MSKRPAIQILVICSALAFVGCAYQRVQLKSETRRKDGTLEQKASTEISSGVFLNGKLRVENLQTTNSPDEQAISIDKLNLELGGPR